MIKILICIALWIIALILMLMFFRGANKEYKEKDTIEIKYINFKDRPTLINQIHKCEEEFGEFLRAALKNDSENLIEEYHDSIMAMNNTVQILGMYKSAIGDGQAKHFKKLEDRGWELK